MEIPCLLPAEHLADADFAILSGHNRGSPSSHVTLEDASESTDRADPFSSHRGPPESNIITERIQRRAQEGGGGGGGGGVVRPSPRALLQYVRGAAGHPAQKGFQEGTEGAIEQVSQLEKFGNRL